MRELKYYTVTLVNKKDGRRIQYEFVQHVVYDAVNMRMKLYFDDGETITFNPDSWWIYRDPKIIVRY